MRSTAAHEIDSLTQPRGTGNGRQIAQQRNHYSDRTMVDVLDLAVQDVDTDAKAQRRFRQNGMFS